MQLPWQTVEIGDYAFDAPAAIVAGRLHRFGSETWRSGEAWQDTLSRLPETPSGFVLPLEVSAQGHAGQDLLGYTLLVYLRFGAPPGLVGLPVLVTAWQPLEDVLRRQPDLLIVAPAVEYHTMLDARQRLAGFIADVSSGALPAASKEQLEEAAHSGGRDAARASYHDLANDYYAAHRIWLGYKALLESAADSGDVDAKRRATEASHITFEWEPTLKAKLRTPLVRRFQAQRAGQPAPRYPLIDEETTAELVAAHARDGLPGNTRILLVDDEFDQGAADVLLPVLFHEAKFTRRLADEWVYAEPDTDGTSRWARFVCVRDVERARNWLAYWEGLESSSEASWHAWLREWDKALSPQSWRRGGDRQAVDVFGDDSDFALDQQSAGPRTKSTVVMLDLRLQRLVGELYSVRDLPSYEFRRVLKAHRRDIPVIMFTASRQILNFAQILESASEIDGWFIKEGPDIPDDVSNSANAVAYLLERLHLYSTLRGWYRPSFEWTTARQLAFASLFHSAQRWDVLADVSRLSTKIFTRILQHDGDHPAVYGQKFKGWVNAQVPAGRFPIAQTLVARRVAVAALLWTCEADGVSLAWNAQQFATLLPGDTGKKVIKAVYDKFNFNETLWMRSQDVLSQLMIEEVDWLLNIDWPRDRKAAITDRLRYERESLA